MTARTSRRTWSSEQISWLTPARRLLLQQHAVSSALRATAFHQGISIWSAWHAQLVPYVGDRRTRLRALQHHQRRVGAGGGAAR